MAIKNKIGERTEPCLTPLVIVNEFESSEFTQTLLLVPVSHR